MALLVIRGGGATAGGLAVIGGRLRALCQQPAGGESSAWILPHRSRALARQSRSAAS